jgi:hypothetical protein
MYRCILHSRAAKVSNRCRTATLALFGLPVCRLPVAPHKMATLDVEPMQAKRINFWR